MSTFFYKKKKESRRLGDRAITVLLLDRIGNLLSAGAPAMEHPAFPNEGKQLANTHSIGRSVQTDLTGAITKCHVYSCLLFDRIRLGDRCLDAKSCMRVGYLYRSSRKE
jgi:hypothetical protein